MRRSTEEECYLQCRVKTAFNNQRKYSKIEEWTQKKKCMLRQQQNDMSILFLFG